jgi:hypothetical protein
MGCEDYVACTIEVRSTRGSEFGKSEGKKPSEI